MAAASNARQIAFALREHGQDVEKAVGDELAVVAQMAVRKMRELAAKGPTSSLVNSIKADKVGDMAYEIGPHVAHAPPVEDGVKPGGKGLPRFFDPASKSIVEWLQRTAFTGRHKPGMATRALQGFETELRDRYEGLAWHIRHFGVKAQPFVAPTADAMETIMLSRLDLAVRRALGARGRVGGAA